MKNLCSILLAMSLSISVFTQAPQKMSYQAVIRNSSNQLVTNQTIGMKISILQGAANSTAVYSETQTPTTNANGLVSIEIGGGDGFDLIDWANGPYFIKTETDPEGLTNYTISGISELLSVPYALFSANSIFEIKTSEEIASLTPQTGQAVFNSTESLYQIYDGSKWNSLPATCWPQPTTAFAGSDQVFYDGTISTTLAANTPVAQHGTGHWTIITGEGGRFDDASKSTATFTGQAYATYELQWSIATSCDFSTDNVNVFFGQNGAGETITDASGNVYKTVTIGSQTWMAENLKTTKYQNGDSIPNVIDNSSWSTISTGAFSDYGNTPSNSEIYGRLYNWYTVIDTSIFLEDGSTSVSRKVILGIVNSWVQLDKAQDNNKMHMFFWN